MPKCKKNTEMDTTVEKVSEPEAVHCGSISAYEKSRIGTKEDERKTEKDGRWPEISGRKDGR